MKKAGGHKFNFIGIEFEMPRSLGGPSYGLALVVVSTLCLLVIKNTLSASPYLRSFNCSIKDEVLHPCRNVVEELDKEFDLRRESRKNYTRKVGGSSDAKRLYDCMSPKQTVFRKNDLATNVLLPLVTVLNLSVVLLSSLIKEKRQIRRVSSIVLVQKMTFR